MRRILKWLATLIGVLVLVAVLAVGLAWLKTDRAMAKRYVISDPPLEVARDAATLAHGAHLFATRGCAHCHGAQGEGQLVFDAGPVVRIVGPNITNGGRLREMSVDQVAAAIRHAVGANGRPLVFMPSEDFHEMSDGDTAALIAYLQSLPASTNQPPELQVRPLGRLLYALGRFPLLPAEQIDHSPRARNAPAVAATAEYGAYVAKICTGCHGADFAGQHVPGAPASFPKSRNLTPAGLGSWTEADFKRALREGKRPDGSAIDPFMPWQAYSKLSDDEIGALWAYFSSLPPVASKTKN